MESTIETNTESLNSSKKEPKAEKASLDFPIIKIQLPREAALKVQAALQTLKERKADAKADDVLADFLDGVTEEYLDVQIERRTPEDYYFEAAKNIPELREKMILQVKKALQKTDRSPFAAASGEAPRKARKKDKPETEGAFPPPGEAPVNHFSQADFTQ